jgi:hypothetical protein
MPIRQYSRKSHDTNKRYYDRGSKFHEFAVGEFVYLYNSAVKGGLSAKFRKSWVEPWKVVAKKSGLNYVIRNQLKKAYNPVNWKDARSEVKRGNVGNRGRRIYRVSNEEQEEEVPSAGPITGGVPLIENQTPEPRTPHRNNRRVLDTPSLGSHQVITMWIPLFYLQTRRVPGKS